MGYAVAILGACTLGLFVGLLLLAGYTDSLLRRITRLEHRLTGAEVVIGTCPSAHYPHIHSAQLQFPDSPRNPHER